MKNVLITGSNRGIGLAMTEQFMKAGWKVWAGMRKIGESQVEELYVPIELDVLNSSSIQQVADQIDQVDGKLDVLINNAGIIDHETLMNSSEEDIKRIMETNFYGPFRMIQGLTSLLIKSEDARIVNVSSGMGAIHDLHSGNAGYRLSKAGLNAQTILWSKDLESKGIKVNAMCPGWVKTDMGGQGAPRTPAQGADTAFWLATDSNIPSGKFFRDRSEISW